MTPHDYALLAIEAYTAIPDIGIAESASRAIVRQTPRGLCIAFPGTDNLECVVSDLNILLTDVPGIGRIHTGFWEAWQNIATQVFAAIAGHEVTLVGHSLGAAMAICAAADMTLNHSPPASVYAFEPPRVSPSHAIWDLLSDVHVMSTRNGNDLVPILPLDWAQDPHILTIGHSALPFANLADHAMSGVAAALTNSI